MEDVLEVYRRPHNPSRPLVCLDEASRQLIAETRMPPPMGPGRPARLDYEYRRNGTANLFMPLAPLEGWRHVKVTERRTAVDYARVLKEVADTHFPKAEKITLVQDNLNPQARQLAQPGRVRAGPHLFTMSRPPHSRQANPHQQNHRLGSRPKQQ